MLWDATAPALQIVEKVGNYIKALAHSERTPPYSVVLVGLKRVCFTTNSLNNLDFLYQDRASTAICHNDYRLAINSQPQSLQCVDVYERRLLCNELISFA